MPLDYSHPKVIRYLKERYNKENEDRISWFVNNKEEIIKTATLTEKHKGYHTEDIARALILPIIPVLSQHHKVTKVNRLTKMQIDDSVPFRTKILHHVKESVETGFDVITAEAKMKPVDPNVRKILFEEMPLGRQKYLNVRYKKLPEERYYSYETSNSVYGWTLGDSEHMNQSGEYRLYDSLMRETMNQSGPQPDPKHYGHVLQQFSKCRQ